MKASHSIVRNIWFSLSIMLIGYLISMVSGFFLAQKTENRLAGVSEIRFPIAQMSERAQILFKEQVRTYADAIFMGDSDYLKTADEKSLEIRRLLKSIAHMESKNDMIGRDILQTIDELEQFKTAAKSIYPQFIRHYKNISERPTLANQIQELASQTAYFQGRLKDYAERFSADLKKDLAEVKHSNRRQRYIEAVLLLLSAVAGGLGVAIIAVRRIVRPVQALAGVARQIQSGDLHKQAMVTGKDEIGELAVAFNHMTRQLTQSMESLQYEVEERKEVEKELKQHREHLEEMVQERSKELEAAQNELVKREKLSVLGQLTATVSHELRNPLGVIQTSAFYLKRKIKAPGQKISKHIERIDEQVVICNKLVEDLLEYTRGKNIEIKKTDLNAWIKETLHLIEAPERVKIKMDLEEGVPTVNLDQNKMQRVVINLLNNAIAAVIERLELGQSNSPQEFDPTIHVLTCYSDNSALIRIEDNGIGMDGETQRKAFEPLFTTRARGTGLGLAIVQKIVADHNGSVTLQSHRGQGTKIEIRLAVSN